MGKIAAHYSNILFVTSDNPRTENSNKIIKEIEVGVLDENFIKKDTLASTADTDNIYFIEENRSIAIKEGISMAKSGDVVLIAGKGHETYQISGNNKYHFDDREEAMRALKLCA
jgi:UDP-N-acetylmuramyl tripeptide synthase